MRTYLLLYVSSCYLQHTLAKLYIEILGLGKDSAAAQKLIHYRAPRSAKAVSLDTQWN